MRLLLALLSALVFAAVVGALLALAGLKSIALDRADPDAGP